MRMDYIAKANAIIPSTINIKLYDTAYTFTLKSAATKLPIFIFNLTLSITDILHVPVG